MTSENRAPPENDGDSKRWLMLLFAVVAIAFIAAGYLFQKHETDLIRDEKYHDLKAIADLKSDQIISWRKERISDARLHSASPFVRDAVHQFILHPNDSALRADMRTGLSMLQDMYDYENIMLAGPDGRILLSLDPRLTKLEPQSLELVHFAVSSDDAFFGDFFRCPVCGQVHLDVAAPIMDDQNRPLAVLILRVNPETFLYPMIQSWPLPSRSGESLLVRKEGNNVLFLNRLRHRSEPPLSLTKPVSASDLPATRAVMGQTGLFEGRDYRDVAVLTDIRSIPGASWCMICKIDSDEIFADVRRETYLIGFLTLMLILLSGAGLSFYYKHRGKRTFEALYAAEKERVETHEEFKTTLYSIGDAVITTDVQGRVRRINPIAEQLTGWTEKDAQGNPIESVFSIISEKTREMAENPIQKVLKSGRVVGLANHTLLVTKAGDEIPITDSGAPIRDAEGEIAGVVLVFRDQVREREIENLIHARLCLLEYANDHSLGELLQKTLDELGSMTRSPIGFYHFLEPDQKTISLQTWSTRTLNEFCKAEGKGLHYDIDNAGVWVDCVHARRPVIHNDHNILLHKKGMPEGHATVVRELVVPIIRDDLVVAILGVGNKPEDYTEKDIEIISHLADATWEIVGQKRAEETLRNLTSRQAALLSAIPDIVMEVDINKVYTWANPAGYAFFGDDVIGREAAFYFEGEQDTYDRAQPLFDVKEEVIHLESWQRRKDGKKRLLAWWCKVLKNENGEPVGGLSSARDITDQRVLQEQFRHAQKMESVGRLAGGIAHDFNNMLGVIIGHTEMMLERRDLTRPIIGELQEVLNAAQRSALLTRQLLGFARKQVALPVLLDINETISSMLKMLRRMIGEDIELVWLPCPEPWPVKIDPSQVDQILANLLVNAKDAIKGVGSVTIETEKVVFDEIYCESHNGFIPGKYVMMAVSDTGSGIPKEMRDIIFEPFYTTKDVGQGTGLGLATVYGIVKQNNGFINVYSEPGQGTVFKIYLPGAGQPVKTATKRSVASQLNGTETILLVEDEEAILNMAKSILENHGYTVFAARKPSEAMVLAKSSPEHIHLLVTDVVMPEMDGRELLDALMPLYPELKHLFMSGYTANTIVHHGVLDEGVNFLQKPFSVKTLLIKVREVIEA